MEISNLITKFARASHASTLPYYTPDNCISMHLGYPDREAFPISELKSSLNKVLTSDEKDSLQYCEEEGHRALRSILARYYDHCPNSLSVEDILITQGTSDALEIVPSLFTMPGDTVLMEAPTYLWAIRVFQLRGIKMVGVRTDEHGLRTDELKSCLAYLKKKRVFPKFLYVMPDFQNPGGFSMTLERRRSLIELAHDNDLLIVEDNPYQDLYYSSQRTPSLFELDSRDVVLQLNSFSKTISPGVRLDWTVGPSRVIRELARMRQTGACTLLSYAVRDFLSSTGYAHHLERTRALYKRKSDAMNEALSDSCPKEVQWVKPNGGFYFWLMLPHYVDIDELYEAAARDGILFLKGRDFFCDSTKWNGLRLSISCENEERLVEGATKLGSILRRICEHVR